MTIQTTKNDPDKRGRIDNLSWRKRVLNIWLGRRDSNLP